VGRQVLIALYLIVMIALIVGLDVLFLRNHFWARLATNVGIVAVFLAVYYAFLKR
jgi:hypothetical protein